MQLEEWEQDFVLFHEIFFAKNEVRLEEEQYFVLFDAIFAKNNVRLEEELQDLVIFLYGGGSCHQDPGYV